MAQIGQYDQQAAAGEAPDFELLPKDAYVQHIIESDIVDNKSNTGKVLKLTWEVLSEGFKGRKIWQNINIQHQNPKAQEIGQRELANIKAAVGIQGRLEDTLHLHNKPTAAKVDIEKQEGHKDRNRVVDVYPVSKYQELKATYGGAAAPAAAAPAPYQAPAYQQPAQQPVYAAPAPAAAPAQAPAPAAAGGQPAWMRRAAA